MPRVAGPKALEKYSVVKNRIFEEDLSSSPGFATHQS